MIFICFNLNISEDADRHDNQNNCFQSNRRFDETEIFDRTKSV